MQFHIEASGIHNVVDGKYVRQDGFKVVGYQTAGVNHPVESDTTLERSQAEAWCDAANRGDMPKEAKWASYNDD